MSLLAMSFNTLLLPISFISHQRIEHKNALESACEEKQEREKDRILEIFISRFSFSLSMKEESVDEGNLVRRNLSTDRWESGIFFVNTDVINHSNYAVKQDFW